MKGGKQRRLMQSDTRIGGVDPIAREMQNFDLPLCGRITPRFLLGKPTRVTGMHVARYRRNFMSNRLHQHSRVTYPLFLRNSQ